MQTTAELERAATARAAHLHQRHDLPRFVRSRRSARIGTRPRRDTSKRCRYGLTLPDGAVTFCVGREKKRRLVRRFGAKVTRVYEHCEWRDA